MKPADKATQQNVCVYRPDGVEKCGAQATIGGHLCAEHAPLRQCTATAKSSGNQCQRVAVLGATVCNLHGGMSPQVQKSAAWKLADLVDPALKALYDILADKRALHSDKIKAAKEVLDRVEGYAPIKAQGGLSGMLGDALKNQGSALALILANPEAQRGLDAAAREAARVLPQEPEKDAENAGGRIIPGPGNVPMDESA